MTRPELLAACTGYIDFTAEGAQGVHDGSKTRTMRLIKDMECSALSDANMNFKPRGAAMCCFGCQEDEESRMWCYVVPKYKPGDLLYVREPWERWSGTCLCEDQYFRYDCSPDDCDRCKYKGPPMIVYAADCANPHSDLSFRAPETMPPEAARTFLRVTEVKAQRAMELTVEEIIAEGVEPFLIDCRGMGGSDTGIDVDVTKLRWKKLFRSIYPPRQYGETPWCWAYRLERVGMDD